MIIIAGQEEFSIQKALDGAGSAGAAEECGALPGLASAAATTPAPRHAVGIGKFDGVHLGHQRLFDALFAYRSKAPDKAKTVIFTFDPSPEAFFSEGRAKCLTTREEKRRLLAACGVDVLVEYPFRKETAAVPPEEFLRRYVKEMLCAGFVAAGEDLSFGHRGSGDFSLLERYGKEQGIETRRVPKLTMEGAVVSSTRIRGLVETGEMEQAALLLGRPYAFLGEVVHGDGRGRQLGVPTLNLLPAPEKALPPFGVYYSMVQVGEESFCAVTNIGVRPTVAAHGQSSAPADSVSVETHLLDTGRDFYGMQANVQLLAFRRPEKAFSDLETLRRALEEDREAARIFHRNRAENHQK